MQNRISAAPICLLLIIISSCQAETNKCELGASKNKFLGVEFNITYEELLELYGNDETRIDSKIELPWIEFKSPVPGIKPIRPTDYLLRDDKVKRITMLLFPQSHRYSEGDKKASFKLFAELLNQMKICLGKPTLVIQEGPDLANSNKLDSKEYLNSHMYRWKIEDITFELCFMQLGWDSLMFYLTGSINT